MSNYPLGIFSGGNSLEESIFHNDSRSLTPMQLSLEIMFSDFTEEWDYYKVNTASANPYLFAIFNLINYHFLGTGFNYSYIEKTVANSLLLTKQVLYRPQDSLGIYTVQNSDLFVNYFIKLDSEFAVVYTGMIFLQHCATDVGIRGIYLIPTSNPEEISAFCINPEPSNGFLNPLDLLDSAEKTLSDLLDS